MDFDLSQVSDNAPTLFNSSSRNSSDGNRISDNRFDSTNIVGSVYHDNAEKLHSDLIGIEEEAITDEMDDKNGQHTSDEITFSSYVKQHKSLISTTKDPTSLHNNYDIIGLSKDFIAKENIFFDENDMAQHQKTKMNKFGDKQVETSVINLYFFLHKFTM